MKVLYELDLNDIIRIVAEKYEVPQEKVKKTNKDGLNYLMIDMSETETPITTREYMDLFHPKKKPEPADEETKNLISRLKKTQTKRTESGITVYTCPVCQKEFNTEKYPDYAYKKQIFNQKHIFCGYACMRKAEKLM